MTAANPKFRQWIVEIKMPFIAAWPCLRGHHSGGETTVLGQVGRSQNMERIDYIDRYAKAKPIDVVDSLHVLTSSIGTLRPNRPVAGSETSTELITRALCISPEPSI